MSTADAPIEHPAIAGGIAVTNGDQLAGPSRDQTATAGQATHLSSTVRVPLAQVLGSSEWQRLWLVEACGYLVRGQPVVHDTTRACSLPRAERIDRERAFRKGRPGASAGQAEANSRAAALFGHLARTASPAFAQDIRSSRLTVGYYRVLEDNGNNCHVDLFVGTDRISVGSCYWKGNFDDATLERVSAANAETSVDPEPDQRYLRGSWWHLRHTWGATRRPSPSPPEWVKRSKTPSR